MTKTTKVTPEEARALADKVAKDLNASDLGIAVTVEWDHGLQTNMYIMWTYKDGIRKNHRLSVDDTPAERLEAHLHGFMENIKSLDDRMFHVVAVNTQTGREVRCTETPVTHKEGAVMMSKFSHNAFRSLRLVEV